MQSETLQARFEGYLVRVFKYRYTPAGNLVQSNPFT
jgi:hypothetical protein